MADQDIEAPPPYASSAQPPSYDSIGENAPPPSYESLYGRVRAAKASSENRVDFFKQFLRILASTIGCTIGLAFILAIPIAMIVIGSMFLHDCPAERYIPIYLIVAGVFGCIRSLSSLSQRIKNRLKEQDDENVQTNPIDGILGLFLFCWFIAGNVWIYGTYGEFQSDNPAQQNYCDATLYWFSFWLTTATYIMMTFLCCCVCCMGCLAAMFG